MLRCLPIVTGLRRADEAGQDASPPRGRKGDKPMEKMLSVGEAAELLKTTAQRSAAGCRTRHQVRPYWPTRAHSEIGLGRLRRRRHRRVRRLLLTGATLADLKKRLGHSSSAAAQRYMHAIQRRASRSPRSSRCSPQPTTRKREPAPRSKSGQPWDSSCDLLRRLNCPGRPRPPDPQIKNSSRSGATVDLTCTELTPREGVGRLATHGVPREQTRDARQTSRP